MLHQVVDRCTHLLTVPMPLTRTPDLVDYDLVLVNTSAGKDSQAMLDHVVALADAQGVDRSRLVCFHADLGRVEWPGTADLAAAHAAAYGLRIVTIARPQGDHRLRGERLARGRAMIPRAGHAQPLDTASLDAYVELQQESLWQTFRRHYEMNQQRKAQRDKDRRRRRLTR